PVSPNLHFWLPLLHRAAADGIDVMLDGEGGDEVFGLSPLLIADRLRRGRLVSAVSLTRRIPGSDERPSVSGSASLLRRYGVKGATPLFVHRTIRRLRGPERYAPAWFSAATARVHFES